MKKTSKIFALILSLIMVMSIASVFAINASAETAPAFNVKETSKSGNKVTVAVDLTSGTFNALDFQFNTSDGVKCDAINVSGNVMGVGNTANGSVSAISTSAVNPGTVITATFTVPEDKDYSISGSASNCAVSSTNANGDLVNNTVSPKISGSVSGKGTGGTDKPETPSSSSSSSKPSSSSSSSKPSSTKSTAKPTSKSTTRTTTRRTTTRSLPTTSLPSTTTSTTESTSSTTLEALTDSIFEEEDYPDYYTEPTEDEAAAEDAEEEEEPINVKLIAAIAGGALVLVGGAVAAIIATNKKRNNEEDDEDDYE